jgi:hypothetical protein
VIHAIQRIAAQLPMKAPTLADERRILHEVGYYFEARGEKVCYTHSEWKTMAKK